mmetsp:Transcript_23424/g.67252  ORF Transcript_23424/g.67252 Transcript_23424/m.67252 type:complete len:143 (+) Transcript_23424:1237-1665(+)
MASTHRPQEEEGGDTVADWSDFTVLSVCLAESLSSSVSISLLCCPPLVSTCPELCCACMALSASFACVHLAVCCVCLCVEIQVFEDREGRGGEGHDAGRDADRDRDRDNRGYDDDRRDERRDDRDKEADRDREEQRNGHVDD